MSGVCTVQDLIRKYGTKTIGLVVQRFITRAPEFEGDGELARELGVMMADLETALNDSAYGYHCDYCGRAR